MSWTLHPPNVARRRRRKMKRREWCTCPFEGGKRCECLKPATPFLRPSPQEIVAFIETHTPPKHGGTVEIPSRVPVIRWKFALKKTC